MGSKAYRVWDLNDERVVISWTVRLHERPSSSRMQVVVVRESGNDVRARPSRDHDWLESQPYPSAPGRNDGVEMDVDSDNTIKMEADDGGPRNQGIGVHQIVPREWEIRTTPASHRSTQDAGRELLGDEQPSHELVIAHSRQHVQVSTLSNALVFSGGSSNARVNSNQQPRHLPSRSDDVEKGGVRRLTIQSSDSAGGAQDTDGTGDRAAQEDGGRSNKRQRLDDYEIALSAADNLP